VLATSYLALKKGKMTDKQKCKAGIYDNVNVVIIRIKEILSDCKIDKKAKLLLEDIRDNNWQGRK